MELVLVLNSITRYEEFLGKKLRKKKGKTKHIRKKSLKEMKVKIERKSSAKSKHGTCPVNSPKLSFLHSRKSQGQTE